MGRKIIIYLTFFFLGSVFTVFIGNIYQNLFNISSSPQIFLEKSDLDMTQFWDVYGIIKKDFYSSSGSIKKNDLVQGAIKGMVAALGDEHSEFMSPEVTEKFNESLSGDFEGIGAVVEKVSLGVQVEMVIKGSPAKKFDIRAGDIILSANGIKLQELDIYDAVDKIKGPAGSSVELEILRTGEKDIIKKTLLREKIHIPSVEHKILEKEKMAYISINMFGDSTAQEFLDAMKELQTSDTKGLILDVRDNGGGYLQSAVQILSYFVEPNKPVVTTRYKKDLLNEEYLSIDTGNLYNKKMIILINENSASASEITAGALREYDKGILLGTQSYGKGSVQQPFEMLDGSLLKLTVAKWYTPKGKNIEDEGITPDVEVLMKDEDYKNSYDRQLEEAKKLLELYIEKGNISLAIEAYKNQK